MGDRMNSEFYVGDDGRTIFKAPVSKPQPGGGISMTIGFPVCEVFEYVKNPEAVAKLLTLGEQADAPGGLPRVATAGAVHVIGASIVRARKIMEAPDA